MMRSTRVSARQMLLYATIFGFSACGADSCSCDGFVAQEFPVEKVDKTIAGTGEVRLTSSGVQFLEDNLPAIVSGLLPGGLNFCVPPTSQSGFNVCNDGSTCSSGELGCDMTLTLDDAEVVPQPPDTLHISLTIGDLNETLPVRVLGSDCTLELFSQADRNLPAQIFGEIPLQFEVDTGSPFNDVRINVGEPVVDIDDVDWDIDAVGILDIPVCAGVSFATGLNFVRDFALGLLTDQFVPLIQEQVDSQLCVQCDAGCPNGTTCDGEGVCRYGDDTCAQSPLGVSGELQLGTILADFTERPGAAVDLTVRAADTAIVDNGLTLGLRSGYDPVETSLCAPVDPTIRDFAPTPLSPTVTGNATPFGQPFHFGLGYHKKAIEHMLWSVWGSGATCLNIGTSSIDLLTTGTLGALLPSVRQLAYSKVSEAYVKIVPQRPPQVILGANSVTPSGSSYTVNDPLLLIDWKDFDVHIYVFGQDRFVRAVTIRMDLELPIAIVPDGMGSIIPVIGDLGDAFTNERIVAGDLVAEDPERILELLPTLIGFALPSLAGSISGPIEVPEFFGFRIDIPEGNITSVDNNTSIAIFANLEVVTMPLIQRAQTVITGTEVDLSKRTPSGLIRPTVYVDVLPFDGSLDRTYTPDTEVSYRVNGGTWSLFERTAKLAIEDPMLLLPGEHAIDVRARVVGMPYTVDQTPASTTVMVDWEAPIVQIERREHIVTIDVDDITRREELQMRTRVIDGQTPSAWSDWTVMTDLDLEQLDVPDRFRLDVEVRDRTGNVGRDTQTVTWRMRLDREDPPTVHPGEPARTAGCSATGSSGPTAGWLLVFAGMFLLRRPRTRRRRRLRVEAIGLAAVICLAACKCGDDTGDTLVCEPACVAGQLCIDGACVDAAQCATDDDCAEGERCEGGECINAPTCEELCDCADGELAVCDDDGSCGCIPYCDKGCDDAEYCCYESNTCESLPDPCGDTMCDIGFGPVVTTEPNGDSPTCAIDPGACECQELPPLPLGWHGHYASIDRNAGVTAIATYNSTYRDLMVGTIDAALAVTWDFVDGVPATGDVEGSLNGPRGGIADRGDDIGRFSALTIDDDGVLHAFYRDHTRGVLKYARGSVGGPWEISDADTEGDVGFWSSAVHQDGRIHVVYTAKSAPDGGAFITELRHMSFDASGSLEDPTAARVSISSGPADHPCGSDCTDRPEECIASLGQCLAPTNDCTGDCADGSACYQGVCELTHKEPPVGYLRAIGTNAQLSKTSTGLLVVYYDHTQRSAAWSRFDGTTWSAPTFVGAGTGPWIGGMVDASDNIHLAYTETVGEVPQLTYADVTAGTTEIVQDGIRDTATWWLVNDIGEDVDLRVASDGAITLLFQDATEHVLKMATRSTAGVWNVSDVATPGMPYSGGHGFYAAMLKLPDAQFSVELTINNQLDPTEAAPEFHE